MYSKNTISLNSQTDSERIYPGIQGKSNPAEVIKFMSIQSWLGALVRVIPASTNQADSSNLFGCFKHEIVPQKIH